MLVTKPGAGRCGYAGSQRLALCSAARGSPRLEATLGGILPSSFLLVDMSHLAPRGGHGSRGPSRVQPRVELQPVGHAHGRVARRQRHSGRGVQARHESRLGLGARRKGRVTGRRGAAWEVCALLLLAEGPPIAARGGMCALRVARAAAVRESRGRMGTARHVPSASAWCGGVAR
jgi:hypothetical protein